MPHITIEHSGNIGRADAGRSGDLDRLVGAVHAAAATFDFVELAALRVRTAARTHYRIADGDPSNAFVAIRLHIGPGRSDEQKTALLMSVLDAAEESIGQVAADAGLAVAFSAELTEIDATFRVNRNHVRDAMARRAPSDRSHPPAITDRPASPTSPTSPTSEE